MAKSTRRKSKKRKNPGGRPYTTGIGTPLMVRLHNPLLRDLDRWIKQNKPRVSRPEALRRLAAQALAA